MRRLAPCRPEVQDRGRMRRRAVLAPLRAACDPMAPPSPSRELAGAWAGTLTHAGESEPCSPWSSSRGRTARSSSGCRSRSRTSTGPRSAASRRSSRATRCGWGRSSSRTTAARTLDRGGAEGARPGLRDPADAAGASSGSTSRREPEIGAPLAQPVWTFDAGSPLWAGPTFADGTRLRGRDRTASCTRSTPGPDGSGGPSGREGRSGRGPTVPAARSTSRPTTASSTRSARGERGRALAGAGGREADRAAAVRQPEVALRPVRLGRDGGRRPALPRHARRARSWRSTRRGARRPGVRVGRQPSSPRRRWTRAASSSARFDGHVYALDAASGKLLWKRDTQGAVVSTPAVAGDRVVVGNRGYDLLGLDARTGEPAWTRYIWFSWVESSAVVRDGVAYVGSSDAAAVYAFDARTGRAAAGRPTSSAGPGASRR